MSIRNVFLGSITAGLVAMTGVSAAQANDFEPQIMELVNAEVRAWLSDPVLINAVKAQNEKHAGLSDGDISSLDQQWRSEAESGSGALIDAVLANELSKFLGSKKEASGAKFSEIFVMDNKGLNVGQSDVTSDYMQGDEAKWQKTYQAGPDAVFLDEVEFDDSSQTFQSQVSLTVVDPADGSAIGAITLGVNVENL